MTILALTCAVLSGGALLIITASLMRCPKCRGWHDSALEEHECKGEHCE